MDEVFLSKIGILTVVRKNGGILLDRYDSRYNRDYDVEVSHDVTPDAVWVEEDVDRNTRGAKALGIASLVLSILGFFYMFYFKFLLATAGIILGVLGVKRGSSLGWWGIALGVIALIVNLTIGLITLPFRLFY